MNNSKLLIGLFALLLFLQACREDAPLFEEEEDDIKEVLDPQDLDFDIARDWMDLQLEVERFTPGYRPPTAARSLAYTALAAYEAVAPATDNFRSIQTEFGVLEIPSIDSELRYNWEIVLNTCYSECLGYFYPTAPTAQQSSMLQMERAWRIQLEEEEDDLEVIERSINRGRAIAEIIYNWSTTDETGHESYLKNTDPNYSPPQGPGLWQPTYPDYAAALFPNFGDVRTFAAGKDVKVKDPLPYSEDPGSQLYAQALETMNWVNEIKAGDKYEDKWIAEFWSDDCPILTFTPAGRWIAITSQVMERNGIDLAKALYSYAKVGIALSDAGVRSWDEKYRINYLRPIDYIHEVMGETDWNTIMCPDGSGQYFTPNFPTYPSGHATFSAAAAEVLSDIYGNHFPFTDRCHEGRSEFLGTPRSYQSFLEMAEENAISRVPLGVHFRMDSESGTDLGRKVGREVNKLKWHK
jgi:hypothetical protein